MKNPIYVFNSSTKTMYFIITEILRRTKIGEDARQKGIYVNSERNAKIDFKQYDIFVKWCESQYL